MGAAGNSRPLERPAMRIGSNPLRNGEAPKHLPGQIAAVITYLPNQDGYFHRRLEVIKACLLSMRQFSGVPVMVWDNGSCPALRDWLRDVYKPDYLMLSPNVGKQSARRAMVGMFAPETIIGVTDDDMLFYPGWWDESVKLLTGFPNVGLVSAWPSRMAFDWATSSAMHWAADNAEIETGHFITQQEETDYAVSVGIPVGEHLQRVAPRYDIRLRYNGLTAYATGQHCQFIARAGVIMPYCLYTPYAMGGERSFDEAIDNDGLLRLTTTKRLARHMGNEPILDDKLHTELVEMGLL